MTPLAGNLHRAYPRCKGFLTTYPQGQESSSHSENNRPISSTQSMSSAGNQHTRAAHVSCHDVHADVHEPPLSGQPFRLAGPEQQVHPEVLILRPPGCGDRWVWGRKKAPGQKSAFVPEKGQQGIHTVSFYTLKRERIATSKGRNTAGPPITSFHPMLSRHKGVIFSAEVVC